jgi:tRNA threonylcarbamoyladenosine biosynthesis protein TsaB
LIESGILAIESSGEYCSVAISGLKNEIYSSIGFLPNSQSALLGNLILNLLASSELEIAKLRAISIGSGPGSYTGLRIGLSMAKGLCFSNDIPLVSVDSMQNIASQAFAKNSEIELVIVALDARRNEIYVAILDKMLNFILPTTALILGEKSLVEIVGNRTVAIAGDGAEKTLNYYVDQQSWILSPNIFANAETQLKLASKKVNIADFESLENFEPNYIKPVFITTAR